MSVEFYNKNTEKFFKQTVGVDMSFLYEKFLEKLPDKRGKILDLGCGSGRDSKFFKELGFEVVALDLSEKLAKKASEYIGQDILIQDMRELEFESEFIGVWACASILHLRTEEINGVFKRVFKSLKEGGVFYLSFKYGKFDYIKDGREFTCFDEERFKSYFPEYRDRIMEIFQTSDMRVGREGEKWLNIFFKN